MSLRPAKKDRTLLLTVVAVIVVLIGVVSLLTPESVDNDLRPTTTNAASHGTKAAYLMLQAMGRKASRWNHPLKELNGELDDAQVARTTLVLAEPAYDSDEFKSLQEELAQFLKRGGRVVATGGGAELLPGGETKAAGMLQNKKCVTTPEGPGELARAGNVEMQEELQWAGEGAAFEVAQRCGDEAVVVRYAVGQGEVIWWSSAAAMENDELKNDADLRLLLASVGDGRDVLFDESLHGETKTLWDAAKGLPLGWLQLQAAVLFVLLVLSFSRRRGPLRDPVALPRSSPLEFAESMGDLYEKGGATRAATEAARRRLMRVLMREAGVSPQTVQEGPEAIAGALEARLGGDWTQLREHLMRCQEARQSKVTVRSALALVRALSEDAERVRARLDPRRQAVEERSVELA